jgi:antitoxin HicB
LSSGREPVREWLKSLTAEDRKIVGEDIKTVEFGWPIGMPTCRALGKGLWEVRSDITGGRIARVLFCTQDLYPRQSNGAVARIRQENSEDTGCRPWVGDETQEGGHMKKKGRIGSSFDDFLKEEGIYAEVSARAIKRVIAHQLDALMQDKGLTKSALAKRMHTSRAQLDRLLDPDNESVTLDTLTRAARAVGRHLRMELV